MERLLVSIGLLTYNHGKYITDVLEGLLSQKYERMKPMFQTGQRSYIRRRRMLLHKMWG